MTKKKKKLLLIIAGAVVVVVLVVANLTMNGSQATSAQVKAVMYKNVTETVSASGRIQPQTKVDITSEINGEIVGLYVREGDRVGVGQLLVVLDTVQLRTAVDQARYAVEEIGARVVGAESNLEQATEEFERQSRLFDRDLTSDTQYKNAKYAFQNARAAHDAMKAQAKQLESNYERQLNYLQKAKIVAPMAGVITFLECEVGEIAAAQTGYSQGRTLMTISNLSVFEVEVEVDETEINKIELGQESDIEVDAFPDTSFAGEVVEIGNTAIASGLGSQDQSTNFRVKVAFTDPRVKLRPGMSATVDITSATRDDVLVIPYSAVVMRTLDLDSLERTRAEELAAESGSTGVAEVHAAEAGDSLQFEESSSDEDERKDLKGVFVIRDGKARFVQIESGIADQKDIEVTSGLTEQDTVITGPYRVLRSVKDGDAIDAEIRDEKDENGKA